MAFRGDKLEANLPDAFRKDPESVNARLLAVEADAYGAAAKALVSVFAAQDLDQAAGAALDMYGDWMQTPRGNSDDTQYRIRIKFKISQSYCDGTRDGLAAALAFVLGCEPEQIKITTGEETGVADLLDVPLAALFKAGFTIAQTEAMVETLLPVGVHLFLAGFSGSFEFGEGPEEYDEAAGFADLAGTVGGMLGYERRD